MSSTGRASTQSGQRLDLLRAMVGDLEQYILSDQVYWALGERGPRDFPYPKLTVGGLLALLHRLQGERDALPPAQQTELDQLAARVEALRARWAANFDRKAERELRSRLDAWTGSLSDIEARSGSRGNYATDVNVRAMIDFLLEALGARPEAAPHRARLANLDGRLRSLLVPGDFVWEAALAPHYPRDTFWYLYGQPQPV